MNTTRKRPSDDELKALLFSGYEDRSQDLPAGDPVMPTPMALDIDEIQPYELNPRRARNEAWEEIVHSLRATGYRGRFPVTRRPGESHYIPAEGGNTTLQAMKMLAADGDDRFRRIPVEFIPWDGEAATLVAHLVENDARADLIFIDKARALRDAREQLEKELGRRLSHRELARELGERGFKIDPPAISRFEYALDRLAPALPEAFTAGAGEPLVRTLRRYERAAETLAVRHLGETYDAERLRAVFQESLVRHDDTEPDTGAIRGTLAEHLAQWVGADAQAIQLEFESLLRHPGNDGAPSIVTPQASTVSGADDATPPAPSPAGGTANTSAVGAASTPDASPEEGPAGEEHTAGGDANVIERQGGAASPPAPGSLDSASGQPLSSPPGEDHRPVRPATPADLERPGALSVDLDDLIASWPILEHREREHWDGELTQAFRARAHHLAALGESPLGLDPRTEQPDRFNLSDLIQHSDHGMRVWIDLPYFRMGNGERAPGAGGRLESWIWWRIASTTLQMHLLNLYAAEHLLKEITAGQSGQEPPPMPRLVEDYMREIDFRREREEEPRPLRREELEHLLERTARIVVLRPHLYQSLDMGVPIVAAEDAELIQRLAHFDALARPVWRLLVRDRVILAPVHFDDDLRMLAGGSS